MAVMNYILFVRTRLPEFLFPLDNFVSGKSL